MRARDAGADGVQLGTAFLFTPEADDVIVEDEKK